MKPPLGCDQVGVEHGAQHADHWRRRQPVSNGKRLKALKEAKGFKLSFQSCRDAGWVSQQFEMSRRRDALSWSLH